MTGILAERPPQLMRGRPMVVASWITGGALLSSLSVGQPSFSGTRIHDHEPTH